MNISAPFIRRPVATILLAIALVGAGLFAYQFLPVAALPNVNFPVITVSASLPGASPDTMANSVATPLIKQFTTIPSIQTITATSVQGSTQIVIQFDLNRNIDQAAADVQAAIAPDAAPAAGEHDDAAELPQGQPGRRADHPAGAAAARR